MAIRNYGGTLTANATSRAYLVEGSSNDAHDEPVYLVFSGSFHSATCTLQVSLGDTSPFVWTPDSDGAFTAIDVHKFTLTPGMYFRFVNSASGSPQAAITYAVRGEIKAA